LYPGCEICGSSTPKDQITGETSESIKSIISERGGLLKGKLLKYEMGNSLYLCPRHAILMSRGLVKLDFLEELERDKKKVADSIRNAASSAKPSGPLYQIPIQVYEGNFLQAKKKGWQTLQLSLDPRHANDLFSKLLSYIG
jgi:hypothetical protein